MDIYVCLYKYMFIQVNTYVYTYICPSTEQIPIQYIYIYTILTKKVRYMSIQSTKSSDMCPSTTELRLWALNGHIFAYVYTYMYIYTYICICLYIYVYMLWGGYD